MKSVILTVQNIRLTILAFLLFIFCQSLTFAETPTSGNPERAPISWTVNRRNDEVTIQWSLHAANQIVAIEIERTTDQRIHVSVDTLRGQRNRNYTIQYTFIEQAEFAEDTWFRLKMTDTQRRISYSPYVLLSAERTTAGLHILPSPSNGTEVSLLFDQPLKYDMNISIQDRTGKTLYQSVYRPSSKLTIRFNGIPVLAPGFYQVVVDSYDYSARQTLQVQ
jgi:hypothetical protein